MHANRALSAFNERGLAKGRRIGEYRPALVELFLARLALREGQLHEAEAHLGYAHRSLHPTQDSVNKGSVHDTWACILRARGSFTDAAEHLKLAVDLYSEVQHRTYLARAINDLAHTYTQMRRFADSERQLDKAWQVAPLDRRTRVETKYLLARLYMEWGDPSKAKTVALEAIERAQAEHVRSLEAEANITLGRALLETPDLMVGEPAACAKRAQELNRDRQGLTMNLKTEIAANLLLAEVQCRQAPPDRDIAAAYYERAVTDLARVENVFLRSWGSRVAELIARLGHGFRLPPLVDDLHLELHEQRLLFYLLKLAVERAKTDRRGRADRNEVAELLGVSRQAIEQWAKQWIENQDGKRDLLGNDPALPWVLARLGMDKSDLKK